MVLLLEIKFQLYLVNQSLFKSNMMSVFSLSLANRWTDVVLFHSKASHRSREGLKLFALPREITLSKNPLKKSDKGRYRAFSQS